MFPDLENITILCPVSDSFWGEIDAEKNSFTKLYSLHRGHRIRRNAVHTVKGTLLSECLPSAPKINHDELYLVLFTDDLLAYKPKPAERGLFFFSRGDHHTDFEFKVRWVAERYKRISHELLVNDLLDMTTGTVSLLKRLTSLAGCDHYSLWLYNPHTSHFTLSSASFTSEATHVSKDDPRFTLKEALDSKKVFSTGILKTGLVNSAPLQGMASINRFTLSVTTSESKRDILGGGVEAALLCVASFYSSQTNLVFGERIRKLFESFLRAEIANEISAYGTYYSALMHDLAENYEPGKLPEFFKAFVLKITSVLGYESAAIFLDQGTGSQLVLTAIAEFRNISPRGESVMNSTLPAEPVIYQLDRPAKTVAVYHHNKVGYSYDISRDDGNSGIFAERTKNKGQNWIGVPIARSGTRVHGVLRVKNKCVDDKVVPFNSADVDILKNLASIIAYLADVEREYLMREKEAIQQIEKKELQYEELSEFLKTYRHEIKSPLVVVTAASQLLEIAMAKDQMTVNGIVPKKVREVLDDLDMVGNRLSFIANILTFDARELVKELRPCKLFTEIVTPILAFLRLYAKKRGKEIVVDRESLLAAGTVFCDPIAASMVFNILLDNAIKYIPKGGVVKVGCVIGHHSAGIVVESRGLPIHLDEAQKIFLKYFRGAVAKDQKTEGSGIGLFLASEIMRLNGGSIELKHRESPTIFEMRIPLHH